MSDREMVFWSSDPRPPSTSEKKKVLKLSKSKVKLRKGTPAPPSMGCGRKRLIISPAPEDKQLQKKLNFGGEGVAATGVGPRCKGAIFPANSRLEPDENSKALGTHRVAKTTTLLLSPDDDVDRDSLNRTFPTDPNPPTDSGMMNEEDKPPVDNNHQHLQSKSMLEEERNSNGSLECVVVSFSENGNETKGRLESGEILCHSEKSHAALVIGSTIETKNNILLSLARPGSAEEFDMVAAQPLLAGRPPEDQTPNAPTPYPLLESEPQPLAIMLPDTSMEEAREDQDTESRHGSAGMEDRRLSAVPLQPQAPLPFSCIPIPGVRHGPSSEDSLPGKME